jgi:hypothetical protein
MVHSKSQRKPVPIYRSRQAGRSDMEELLAPNFDPAMAKLALTVVAPATVVEIATEDVTASATSSGLVSKQILDSQPNNLSADETATVVEIATGDVTASATSNGLVSKQISNSQPNNLSADETATVVVKSSGDAISTVVVTPPVDDTASVVETATVPTLLISAGTNRKSLSVATAKTDSTTVVATSAVDVSSTVVDIAESHNPDPIRDTTSVSTTVVETNTVTASPAAIERPELNSVDHIRNTKFNSTTVVETDTVGAVVGILGYSERAVSPEKIGILAQARPPREVASDWESLTTGKIYPAKNIQFVSIAQHSMSGGQERFYESIWRSKSDYKFRVDIESREVKRFCAGYDVLSQVCRLATRNVRNMIPVLISKLILHSFRDHDSTVRKGTTYQIFSYEEILRRQRAKGLCYVIKNGPSVEFVAPVGWTVDPTSTVGVSTTVAKSSTVPADVSSTESVDAVSRITMDETSRPLDKSSFISQSTSTILREMLQAQLAKFDHAAVDQLWAACRKNVPDVTVEEVSEIFSLKRRIAFAPGVKNPNGLLITAVANACTHAAISEMRKGREIAAEPEITRTPDEQIADLEFYLREFPPEHEQMAAWKTRLQKLREEN